MASLQSIRSGLKIKSVRSRGQLNIVEAENIRRPTLKLLGGRPTGKRPLHLRLGRAYTGKCLATSGTGAEYRRRPNWTWVVLPHLIPERMAQFRESEKLERRIPHRAREQAAMLHHQAVAIHPFENGNGRWSGLLANIWLRRPRAIHRLAIPRSGRRARFR